MSVPLLVLLCLLSAFTGTIPCEVIRHVSPTNGTNNSSCLYSENPEAYPCKNLSFALVEKEISGAQSQYYCNTSTGQDNLCVYLHDGIHYLSGETQVTNATNVLISALRPGGATVRCRSFPNNVPYQYDDMVFLCSRNITVMDLVFERCGPYGSGIYARNITGLDIRNCTFRNITGVAIHLCEASGVTVQNCTFVNNHNQYPPFHRVKSNETTSADDLDYFGIPSGGISMYSKKAISLEVNNCTFVNNLANNNILHVQRPLWLKPGGHGGAIYLQLPDVNSSNVSIYNSSFVSNFAEINGGAINLRLMRGNNNVFRISSCIFTNNSASETSGGALAIEFSGKCENNSFKVEGCTFKKNHAAHDHGGALAIEIFGKSKKNSFAVEECTFKENSADGGGAVSVSVYDFHKSKKGDNGASADQIALCNTSFVGNSAKWEGSALGLFSFYSAGAFPYDVEIKDCTFSGNLVSEEDLESYNSTQCGAVSSLRFPVHFTGINKLLNNVGGGLSAIGTVVKVEGSLLVHNNTASIGGGILLRDMCLLSLSPGTILEFTNNHAFNAGGGLFVSLRNRFAYLIAGDEDNRFCFIQYQSPDGGDYPPSQWKQAEGMQRSGFDVGPVGQTEMAKTAKGMLVAFIDFTNIYDTNVSIRFINNTASTAGAAFYASSVIIIDCLWQNTLTEDNTNTTGTESLSTLLNPPNGFTTPFSLKGNNLRYKKQLVGYTVSNEALATDAIKVIAKYDLPELTVQPGELLVVQVETLDAFGNNRTAAIEIDFFNDTNILDVSSDAFQVLSPRKVPPIADMAVKDGNNLQEPGSQVTRATAKVKITLQSDADEKNTPQENDASSMQEFTINVCHPGYELDGEYCVCNHGHPDVFRCDGSNRYFYIREGLYAWVDESDDELRHVTGTPPSFLHCSRQGQLPGCLFMFDQIDQQCANGRKGFLCGSCREGTAVSLDLQSCSDQCAVGIIVFIVMCVGVVVISVLILAKNVHLPPELRGFIFYAQVIGLVFGPFSNVINTELKSLRLFLNLLTFSVPLPWCVSTTLPTHGVALLGYISPLLALATLIVYSIIAKYVSAVSSRGVTHGLSLLGLFIYKYVADVSFVTVSCRTSDQGFVFLYDGTQYCNAASFLPFFIIGIAVIVLFVIPAPFVMYVLIVKRWQVWDLYHFTDELTKDMREGRGWYAAWEVGRRLLFILLFYLGVYLDSPLVSLLMFLVALFLLLFHCFIKPYKKETSNVVETLVLLNLLLVAAVYMEAPQDQVASVFIVILTLLPYLYAVGFLMWLAGRKMYAKCSSRVQQCLPEKVGSTLPAVSRPVNRAEPASAATIALRSLDSCVDHHEPIKQEHGSSSVEYSASSAVTEDGAGTPKARMGQHGAGSHSDQQGPRQCTLEQNREELQNETSIDKLFALSEDEIKELRRSSFT